MHLTDIQLIFNRAAEYTFSLRKISFTFLVLVLCGIFVVFCRGLAVNANSWLAMSLTFLPIFLLSGILLALGILLIRIYHNEVKHKNIHYGEVLSKSWEIILGAAYFSIPMILIHLSH